jgi:hypothetical protein
MPMVKNPTHIHEQIPPSDILVSSLELCFSLREEKGPKCFTVILSQGVQLR